MDLSTKFKILDEIRNNVDIFKPAGQYEYRIRCPFCGDSQKDLTDTHCYIKCSNDPNEPLLYRCFLGNCNAKGKVDKYFFKKLGIRSKIIDNIPIQRCNKIGQIKKESVNVITGSPIVPSPQTKYIEDRLGNGFSIGDYDKFKIIWDMRTLYPYISNERIRNTLPSNHDSISFLSDNKSMILTRRFSDSGRRWDNTNIINNDGKSFYTIKATFDLFTSDSIIVNIAEGIFDILSVYKNFNDGENSVYIGLIGSDYEGGVEYAIAKGIIGSNVTIKIYLDNDIDVYNIKDRLRRYKWLFNRIILYINTLSKDVGVKLDRIKLIERVVR